ncbi:MAG: PEP-CTERM sorting domain-containing protein [Leptolyngbyaceae cyanobacterium SL_7_1]|nr:PEP-CTERM sorting domain-containing protein [Leptolyngbyaceae cyanobacterium SL_7_1]
MRIISLSLLVGVAIAASTAPAQAASSLYRVESGTTSLSVDSAALELLESLGLSFSGTFDTVTPADGFAVGFEILSPSDDDAVVGSTFNFNFDTATQAFAPVSGLIEHIGGLSFDVDTFDPTTNPDGLALFSPLEIGDFSIGFDGGFFIADNVTTGLPLFDLVVNDAPSLDQRQLQVTGVDVLVSSNFNALLSNAAGSTDLGLTGAKIGTAQIDANASKVPEPGTVVAIALAGAAAIFGRRRAA